MQLRGINDLPRFLRHLRDISGAPWYRLSHDRDVVTVAIDMVGVRLEVDFLEERVAYRIFEGDESVFDDEERLLALVGEKGKAGSGDAGTGAATGGLGSLLEFLVLLAERKIMFCLEQQRDDAIMLTFAVAGRRVEVEWFEDHIEWSVFEGDESVLDDWPRLFALLDERGK